MNRLKFFDEFGRTGLNRFGGYIHEEFLRELQGRRGVEVYKEMSENDDIVSAVLFAMKTLMRQVKWDVSPAGSSRADKGAAAFVLSCMNDMEEAWTDFISDALSFLVYGWSYHEIVYKRRDTDGFIGWKKLPIRSQDTLFEWRYDDNDNLLGMVQAAPPDFVPVFIPLEKALHFKTESRKNNPEGHSVLRGAYRSWYYKRRIQEIEGIGIERDLAGLPVLIAPENLEIWDGRDEDARKAYDIAKNIVTSIRRDEREGIVLPFGWDLKLLSSGGARQFDTNRTIERYDNRIAMTVLADFITLGHENVGSFALSSDKTKLFSVALGTFLDIICGVVGGQAIPRLIELNADRFGKLSGYPKLIHGDIETQNLESLGSFVKNMAEIGALTPDEPLEAYLRMTASLPPKDNSDNYM